MANPVLFLSPARSQSRAGVVSPTLVGSVVDTTDGTNRWWQFLESTSNLQGDNSFETGGATWLASGTATYTQVTTPTAPITDGTHCAKVVTAALGDGIQAGTANYVPCLNGQTWTVSMDLTGAVGGELVAIVISLRDSGGAGLAQVPQSGNFTLSTLPQRFSFTFTISQVGAAFIRVKALIQQAGAKTFYIDRVQVEQKDHATAWATSTRTGGSISQVAPVDLSPYSGSAYIRYLYATGQGQGTNGGQLWSIGSTTDTQLGILLSTALGFFITNDATSGSGANTVATTSGGSIQSGYHEWNGLTHRARGSTATAFVTSARAAPNGVFTPTTVAIADSSTGVNTYAINGNIYSITIFDTPLTPAEIGALDATPTAQLGFSSVVTNSIPHGLLIGS